MKKNITATESSQTKDAQAEIIDWLRDAYAMERALEQGLQKQAESEELATVFRRQAATHLRETRRHAEDIKAVLHSLNTDTSALKTTIGVLGQSGKSLAAKMARDERIKDLLDAYAMEHFEIGCYLALAAAAERAGLPQVVEVCQRIIPDEERMAQAIKDAIPEEVGAYLFEDELVST